MEVTLAPPNTPEISGALRSSGCLSSTHTIWNCSEYLSAYKGYVCVCAILCANRYVCMYVCMYVCVCIYKYMCIYIYMYVCMPIVYDYIHACVWLQLFHPCFLFVFELMSSPGHAYPFSDWPYKAGSALPEKVLRLRLLRGCGE